MKLALTRDMYAVNPVTGCWEWQRATNVKGYPTLGGAWWRKTGRSILVYRVVYEDAGNDVPEGHTVDHLCGNRGCIRLDHLEAVPHAVNVQRGRLAKLSSSDVIEIREHVATGAATRDIAARYSIAMGTVRGIARGANWPGVGGDDLVKRAASAKPDITKHRRRRAGHQ